MRCVETLCESLGLRFVLLGTAGLCSLFGPKDIFHYVYAVFHSPTYRYRYSEFLETDFLHLPLGTLQSLFRDLVHFGAELVTFHLMES